VRAGEVAGVNLSLVASARRGEEENTGILFVDSEPREAQVHLDGALAGQTPLTLESVPAGPHKIRVSRRFFETVDVTETIQPRRATRRELKLSLRVAVLVLNTDLGAGELLVNGMPIGKLQATQKIPLLAGAHRIQIRHPDAGTITRELELDGGPQTIEFPRSLYLGHLTVLSDVPLSGVTVYGRKAQAPPITVENLPGGEVLVAGSRSDGKGVLARKVNIRSGETVVVRLQASDEVADPAVFHSARLGEIGLEAVRIPAGRFQMGCSPDDKECEGDEKPVRTVTISKPLTLGKTEVTVAAYRRYATKTGGQMPSGQGPDDHPVVNVSWEDASKFCAWAGGRLPTEAEWEYAAGGGRAASRYGPPDEIAWYDANSGGKTHPVGLKKPNAYGLYDMLGNVWEWVADWYGPYAPQAVTDPTGPTQGENRVVRGGSWDYVSGGLRASGRFRDQPGDRYGDRGFRCSWEIIP